MSRSPMASPGRTAAWLVWVLLVFGLWNSCGTRSFAQETGHWLSRGDFPISVGTAVRALRAASVDDGDIARYLAYANAVLGRPYQSYFVRPLAGWRAEDDDPSRDPADATQSPPAVPPRPLIPWRDFSVEYPPGFFLFALPPALLADDLDHYRPLFSIAMGLVLTAALLLARRTLAAIEPSRAGLVLPWTVAATAALGVITVRRFDPVVSLALAGMVYGLVTRRPLLAGVAVGLGIATKGLPLLLVPLGLAFQLERRRVAEALKATAAASAVVAALVLPFAQRAGMQLFDVVAYHVGRPLQIESTAGAALVLARFFDPGVATLAPTHGSHNVVSAFDGPLRVLAAVLPLLALAGSLVWAIGRLRIARSEGERGEVLIKAASASLVGVMALGTVFSPQYLVWLIPLGVMASILSDRTAGVLLLIALALTQVEYPYVYATGIAKALHPAFGLLVLVRNVVLLVWAGRLLVRPLSMRAAVRTSDADAEVAKELAPQPS